MSSLDLTFDLMSANTGGTFNNHSETTKPTTANNPQQSTEPHNYTDASDLNQPKIAIYDNKSEPLKTDSTFTSSLSNPEISSATNNLLPQHVSSNSTSSPPPPGPSNTDVYHLKSRDINHPVDIVCSSKTVNAVSSKRVKFKSLLAPSVIDESDEITTPAKPRTNNTSTGGQELIDLTSFNESNSCPSYSDTNLAHDSKTTLNKSSQKKLITGKFRTASQKQVYFNEPIIEEDNDYDDDSENSDEHYEQNIFSDHNFDPDVIDSDTYTENDLNNQDITSVSPSHHRLKSSNTFYRYVSRKLRNLGADLTSKITNSSYSTTISYTAYDESHSPSSSSSVRKYRRSKRRENPEQNFRGSYRYSRIGIVMTIVKKLIAFLSQRSTLALFGAFLIHVTLGTIYTLSNINSYLTSYMRKHGSPNATYGGSMWISSSYAVGQGISMVLGGLIEKRFSARVSCVIGCALHSLSIMSTSKSVDYGQLAVLITYGFLPGFGCGLAYMTPMSNGFGWFPNRKGLVAGVILAGFGIGTFVFNMAQTAYVNPYNLSPPKDANGYFTQDAILNNVPQLFTFLGTIYASMQFVGCCLLFKPPSTHNLSGSRTTILSDEEPILAESEVSFKKAIRTREFIVLFLVFGITNQGVLFVNSMLKEYGQIFITDDLYLAWTGSMASIANSLGRLVWGLAIDRYTFTQCFTSITTIFATLIFIMPFEFVLSSKLLYLLCTLGIFGSFSGWMSTYPVHLSRLFGVTNSGMIYGLIFVSQSLGGILTAFAAHHLIDQYSRFVPFFFVTFLEVLGLAIFHAFYSDK